MLAIWPHAPNGIYVPSSMAGDIVVVDTGPLVALLDPSDRARDRCRLQLDRLDRADLVTTEAVVTEVEYLLDFSVQAQAAFMLILASGRPRVEPMTGTDRPRLGELMVRYADLPIDYADATLIVLAERLAASRVFTLDRRDFNVYRVGRRRFEVLP